MPVLWINNLNNFMKVYQNTIKVFYSTNVLKVGATASIIRFITQEDVNRFVKLSGDDNPIHTTETYANETAGFDHRIVHGAFLNSLVSAVIGSVLPGPGTVLVKQELNFPSPCYVDEEVTITVTLKNLRKISTVDFSCKSTEGKLVLYGYANVVLPKSGG